MADHEHHRPGRNAGLRAAIEAYQRAFARPAVAVPLLPHLFDYALEAFDVHGTCRVDG